MRPTGNNPNATNRKVWWAGDRERAGLNEEISERLGEKREKAPLPLPAWLTWMTDSWRDRLTWESGLKQGSQ